MLLELPAKWWRDPSVSLADWKAYCSLNLDPKMRPGEGCFHSLYGNLHAGKIRAKKPKKKRRQR